ncbi:MAG: hypothetical protein BGO09_06455 [Bacteroidetes bacterium 47-18]|nr:MAG: hypothetical protein BGO09_06455 [Bacteroidetes bacterium 47-18]
MSTNTRVTYPVLYYLLLWLGAFLLFAFCFEPFVFAPNSMLVTGGGDGIKNYFTYWYYICYDSGHHFTGMNYPFGEHIIFTDNMPLLSMGIKKLAVCFPGIVHYCIGILHISMLVAHLIGVHYLFKIFYNYQVAPLWAGIGALLIAYGSPQVFKMLMHFGMSFSCLLPFMIYQLMQYHQHHRLKNVVWIFIMLSLFTFLHLYNFVLTALAIMGYVLAYCLLYGKAVPARKLVRHVLPLLVAIGAVFAGLNYYMRSTDTITDRTNYPLGVFNGATEGKDIFVSDTYLGQLLAPVFGKSELLPASEGYIYIGVVGIVVAIYFVVRVFSYLFSKKVRAAASWHIAPEFNIWLIVAFLSLLIGMGVPFVWFRQFFADNISTLRQFRTIGRFSWIFYYLFMIYTCIVVYRWSLKLAVRQKIMGYGVLGLAGVVWAIQIFGYAQHYRKMLIPAMVTYDKITDKDGRLRKALADKQIDMTAYQAILMLPYFHIGSEKLWLQQETESNIMANATRLSMLFGLPIVDVMMSRTSWSQTFASVQIVDGPFNKKAILECFNDKPLLLAVSRSEPLSYKESEWLQYAREILDIPEDDMTLYTIDLPAYKRLSAQYRDKIVQEATAAASPAGLLHDALGYYYKEDFESMGNLDYGYRGARSWSAAGSGEKRDYITAVPLPDTVSGIDYVFSIWAQVNQTDYRHPVFELFFKDKEGKDLGSYLVRSGNVTMEDNFWFLYDTRFTAPPHTVQVDVIVHSADFGASYLALDELLVRPANAIHYSKGSGQVILNNRTLPMPGFPIHNNPSVNSLLCR